MTTESTTGAMSGLRVIDLTRVLGGPYCTQILADHGADVIKVEPPAGDEVRDWGPPFHDEDAAYFVGINRNKRSIGLDLASEGGRIVLLKMLETADVLIENFKPGTLEKRGIGNEVLREKFPRLVHRRICAFGADAPRGGTPGYDAIIQAMTRITAATGSPALGTYPRFARNKARIASREALRAELAAVFSQHEAEPLCDRLLAAGLPAGPVQKIDQALTNPHTIHRGDVIEKDWYKGVASPIRLERSKPSLRRTPPKFSQHSAEVLAEFGYSKGEIDALVEKGVVCGSERKR